MVTCVILYYGWLVVSVVTLGYIMCLVAIVITDVVLYYGWLQGLLVLH